LYLAIGHTVVELMKDLLLFLFIIFFVSISFLFSPKPQPGDESWCMEYVSLNQYMGAAVNCDSYHFLNASIKPSLLFESNYQRQSRPVYTIIGSALGYSVYYLSQPLHGELYSFLTERFATKYNQKQLKKATLYGCHYIGYLIFNVIVSLLTTYLFQKCLIHLTGKEKIPTLLLAAFAIFLNSHEISKAFFWTSHQQLLNILCPLLCLYLLLVRRQITYSLTRLSVVSFSCGLLVLLYGSFWLLLPSIIYALWFGEKRKQRLTRIILVIVAFLVPVISWISIVELNNVKFYSHEVEAYRQFVWILDALQVSWQALIKQVVKNAYKFILTFPYLLLYIGALLVTFSITKAASSTTYIDIFYVRDKENLLVIGFIFFVFYALLGFYEPRLTFSLASLVLLYFACLTTSYKTVKARTNIIWLCASLLWHAYNVATYGPFS
jgi:hypothetical protein